MTSEIKPPEPSDSSESSKSTSESSAPQPEQAPPEPAADTEPLPDTDRSPFLTQGGGVPRSFQAIVRGGTTTTAQDNRIRAFEHDSNERRAVHDCEKAIASIPVERGGGKMFANNFADVFSPMTPVTYYPAGKSEKLIDMLCDVIVDDNKEHILIFVCPECVKRGVPSGQAQCHVKFSHRKWFLDTRGAGEIRQMQSAGGVTPYVFAGFVMDSEKLTCSNENCGCSYRIHKGKMYRV